MTRKKILPLAMTMAFGLSACVGEQWGDTNDGLANTGTGAVGDGTATSLLLLGGLVGVGAILSSGDSDSGVLVTTAGDSATGGGSTAGGSTDSNGTDGSDGSNGSGGGSDDGSDGSNNSNGGTDGSSGTNDSNNGSDGTDGSGNGSDGTNNSGSSDGSNGSGGTNDDTDGSGDGSTNSDGSNGIDGTGDSSDGSGDNTSNPADDPATTLVDFLEPPGWLLGMWHGTDSNGMSQTAFASPQEIGIGNTGSSIGGYSTIPEVCLHLSQSTDSVFEYTIWYPGADGSEVIINEKWENNTDGSILYTVSGLKEDHFIMHKTKATNYLTPPSWLQGRWQSSSANGGTIKIADISSGNITIGDQGSSRTSLYELASQTGSVVRVNQDDGSNYSVTVVTSGTPSRTVSNTFESTGTNTLNYSGSAGMTAMTRH